MREAPARGPAGNPLKIFLVFFILKHIVVLMNKRRRRLLERLVQEAEVMIQGSLSHTTRTCGHPGCRCHRGRRHGPHTYLTYRGPEGRSRSLYVRQGEEPEFEESVTAWDRFWELAVKVAMENRERMAHGRRRGKRRARDVGQA
jgi:hypothetical protein